MNRAKIAQLRALISITHAHGLATKALIATARGARRNALIKHEQGLEKVNAWRRAQIAELQRPVVRPTNPITMYDSVDISQIPFGAPAVAGYVGGSWPTYNELRARFPHAHVLSIAVNAGEDAECLDIENGDATPGDAVGWFHRQKARGVKRPCFYAGIFVIGTVIQLLKQAGINRSEYRVWTPHYTYVAHIEPGSDATQWTDKALGRNLDQSLCRPDFFA